MANWSNLATAQPMHSVMSPFVNNAYGNALVGSDIDSAGAVTGSKFYTSNVLDMLRAAVEPIGEDDPNPYAIAYAYDGGLSDTLIGEFSDIDDKYDTLTAVSIPVDVTGAPQASAITVGSDEDSGLVAEFEEGVNENYDRYINQYVAGMFEANAHISSPFHIGLALMLASKARQVSAFHAKLKADRAGRQAMVDVEVARINLQAKLQWAGMNSSAAQVELQIEAQRFNVFVDYMLKHWAAQSDRYAQDAAYNVSAVRWGLDTAMPVAQLLSPMGTVPLGPPQPSRLQQGLAMALSNGSNIGMSVGGQFGPAAGIGAGILGGALSFGAALL